MCTREAKGKRRVYLQTSLRTRTQTHAPRHDSFCKQNAHGLLQCSLRAPDAREINAASVTNEMHNLLNSPPVQSRRRGAVNNNPGFSLAGSDTLSCASSSGHSIVEKQSEPKVETKPSLDKELGSATPGTGGVKFAATHRAIKRRKSSVIFGSCFVKYLPPSRPLRMGSTSVGE